MYTIKQWVTGVVLCCLLNLCLVQSSQAQGCEVCPGGGSYNYGSMTYELPTWPGCPITFDYTWRECPDGTFDYQVYAYYYDPNDPDCAGLVSTTTNPDGSPSWAGVDQVFSQGSQALPQILFMNAYNAALPQDKWQFECPNGKKSYGSRYVACRRWVEIRDPHNPRGGWYFKLESCNDEACCIETRLICFNKMTGQLEVQIISTPSPTTQCPELSDPTDPYAVSWSRCMMFSCPE